MKTVTFLLGMIFGWALAAVAASGPWLTDWPPGNPGVAYQASCKDCGISSSPYTLWDSVTTNGTAAGEIDYISIIGVSNYPSVVSLQICQDNDFNTSCATPSVNAYLEDWIPARGVAGNFWTRYFRYDTANSSANYLSYIKAPFTSHTRISLVGASGQAIYWNIGYHINNGLNWGLYSHLHAQSASGTYGAGNPVLFSTSNGPGVIWGEDAHFNNDVGSALETEVGWNVDGTQTITSSGTEDYFGSSFDWSSGIFATDFLGCTSISGSYVGGYTATAYRLHVLDPITFNSTAQWLFPGWTVGSTPYTASINSLVWYYTQN